MTKASDVYTVRHLHALGHPCYRAEETAHHSYFDRPHPSIGRLLTVNSGFE